MALSFLTTYDSNYFSSSVPDLRVATNSTAAVTVTISAIPYGNNTSGSVIYESDYYPYDGVIEATDLQSIIENYMEQENLAAIKATLGVTSGSSQLSQTFTVVYCKQRYNLDPETFLSDSFLTTATTRITNKLAVECLSYCRNRPSYATTQWPTEHFPIRAIVLKANGQQVTLDSEISFQGRFGVRPFFISYTDVKNLFTSDLQTGDEIIAYTVSHGNRTCTFYVSRRSTQRMFYFRNCFGVFELAILPTKMVAKTETISSTAVCGNISTQYDIQHQRYYEMETSALLYAQAEWLTQFLTSRDIRYFNGESASPEDLPRVLINDYECEISDEPGTVNSLKFTWQFADDRDNLNAVTHQEEGVFTEQFSSQFN